MIGMSSNFPDFDWGITEENELDSVQFYCIVFNAI